MPRTPIPSPVWPHRYASAAQINYGHHLATCLYNCVSFDEALRAIDLYDGQRLSITSTPTVKATVGGIGLNCTGGQNLLLPTRNSQGWVDTAMFTIRIVHTPASWLSFATIVEHFNGARYIIVTFDTAGSIAYIGINGVENTESVATAMTAGLLWDFVMTRDTGGTVRFYVNGRLIGSAANTYTTSGTSSGNLAFGNSPSGAGDNYSGVYHHIAYWKSRCLTPTEVWQMFAEKTPYIKPQVTTRRYWPGAAAVANTDPPFLISQPSPHYVPDVRLV